MLRKNLFQSAVIITSLFLCLLNSGCSTPQKQIQKELEAESSSDSQAFSVETNFPSFDAVSTLSGLNLSEMEMTRKEFRYYGYAPHYQTIYKTKIDRVQLEYDANGYLLTYWDWAVFPGYVAKESIPENDIIDAFFKKFSCEIPHLDEFSVTSTTIISDGKELLFEIERLISDGIKDRISLHTASDGIILQVTINYSYLTEVSSEIRDETQRLFYAARKASLEKEIEPYDVYYSYYLFENNQILAIAELRFYDPEDRSVCTFIEMNYYWIDPSSFQPSM